METLVQAPAWVKERREQAAKRFAEVGFPTTRQEDWRFTNVSPIAEAKYPVAKGPFKQAASLIAGVNVPGSVRLAIVNGEFVPALSELSTLPKGLKIAGLRDGARDGGGRPRAASREDVRHRRASVCRAQHLVPGRRRGDFYRQGRNDRDADSHRHGDRQRQRTGHGASARAGRGRR